MTMWWRWARRRATEGRELTPAERRLAADVFGDALDVGRVRIHARPWWPLQPRRTAMTPDGHVYFRQEDALNDYAARPNDAAWLAHELVHAWQHQTGVWVRLRGAVERRYRYGTVDPARPLPRWGIEQQAAIVEDWFRMTTGLPRRWGGGPLADYLAVIPFLPDAARRRSARSHD
jgi:hypothetical protein